ncbi:MAG: Ig-like domain-containing protein [Acidobacteriota bacterium]
MPRARLRTFKSAILPVLLVLLTGQVIATVSFDNSPVAVDDSATTDDVTPIAIDLLANDSDPDGDRLTVSVGAVSCTGGFTPTVTDHGDGSVTFRPVEGGFGTCTVPYTLSDGRSRAESATATVVVSASSGGPPGDLDPWPAPDEVFSQACRTGGSSAENCCWQEIVRAVDWKYRQGQAGTFPGFAESLEVINQWGNTPASDVYDNSGSENHGPLCAAAKYVWTEDLPAQTAAAHVALLESLLDAQNQASPPGADWMGSEIFSPVYQGWLASVWLVVYNHAEQLTAQGVPGHVDLRNKARNWLRTYWHFNALAASPLPIQRAETLTEGDNGGERIWTHDTDLGWSGLSLGLAGSRGGNAGCAIPQELGFAGAEAGCGDPGAVLARALFGRTQVGHMLNALALDWRSRSFELDNMMQDYFFAPLFVAAVFNDADVYALDGGRIFMDEIDVDPATFGLDASEQALLRDFIDGSGRDLNQLNLIVNNLDQLDPRARCSMTIRRTQGGTSVWFGDDTVGQGRCNVNGWPHAAVTVADGGAAATYLSPAVSAPSARQPNTDNLCVGSTCIQRLGGDLIYEIRWRNGQAPDLISSIPPTGILINDHPASTAAAPGQTVSFSVAASAPSLPMGFEWLKDGQPIVPGAGVSIDSPAGTGLSTLTLTGVNADDQASYRVRISAANVSFPVLSKGAWLAVDDAAQPTCDLQVTGPAAGGAQVGEAVTLTAAVTGADGLTAYQWFKNGAPVQDAPPRVTGATSTVLTLDPVRLEDAGAYALTAEQTDLPGCTVTSLPSALTVTEGTGDVVDDRFQLNGVDRVPGAPLDGTLTETGARQWDAHPPLVFGPAGGLAVETGASPSHYSAGVEFDPADFPSRRALEVSADVTSGRAGEWAAVGFGAGPLNGLWGQGQVWMFLGPNGNYAVRTRGTADPPLASGVATDFSAGGVNTVRLEVELIQGTVSAFVNSQQVLYRSYLPDFADGWFQPTHGALQLRLISPAAPGAPTVSRFELEAKDSAGVTRSPFVGQGASLPGAVEGWHFDLGGEGVGYHDVDAVNEGNVEREGGGLEGVDLWRYPGSDQVTVRSFETTEWLEYTASASAGDYRLTIESISPTGASVSLALGDGAPLGGPWTIPASGEVSQVTVGDDVTLPQLMGGGPALRLRVESGELELVRFRLDVASAAIGPDDDVVVLPFDTTATELVFSSDPLLVGDLPQGEVRIVDTPGPKVQFNGDTITYFPQQSFWSRRWDTFTYLAAHVDDPDNTAEAEVLLLAGGLLAGDDSAVSLCSQGAPTLTLTADQLLGNDRPSSTDLVRITGAVDTPPAAVAQVTWNPAAQAFTFDPGASFCGGGPHAFTYRVELIDDPTYSAIGTVRVYGANPVVALDDEVDFLFESFTTTLDIGYESLLENDAPTGLVSVLDMAASSTFGGTLTPEAGSHRYEPDAQFWARGWDEATYTAAIDGGGSTDTATVRITARPTADEDVSVTPFTPFAGEITVSEAILLANDGPQLTPAVIGLFGVENGARGDALVRDGHVVYRPRDDFWRHGQDTLTYSIWYQPENDQADPDADATATWTFHTATSLVAVDDAFRLQYDSQGLFHFFADQLEHNDRPAGQMEVAGFAATTLAGGGLREVECGFGVFCGKYEYTPPAGGLPAGFDRAEFQVRLTTAPAVVRTGFVYLYTGAAPPLLAVDDLVTAGAGGDLEITFASVLANDVGPASAVEVVQPPVHGQLTTGGDAWTYRPAGGFSGIDFFRYVAVDPVTGRRSAPATVDVVLERFVDAVDDTRLVDPSAPSVAIDIADLLANDRGGPGSVWLDAVTQPDHGALLDFGSALVFEPDAGFAAVGEDRFTYSAVLESGAPPMDEATVRLEAFTGCSGDFADDFEDGDLLGWAVEADGGASVTVNADGLLEGRFAAEVNLAVFSQRARMTSPAGPARSHAGWSFLLNADDLALADGESFSLAQGRAAGTGNGFQVEVRRLGGLQIRVLAVRDGGAKVPSPWAPLPAGSRTVFVDWWAAAAPGLDDGGARLFLDGWLASAVGGVDNDQRRVSQLRLGAVLDVDLGTAGRLLFDDVSSCAGAREPVLLWSDDFEDGDLAGWNAAVAGGGSLTVNAAAALGGQLGLDAALDGSGRAVYLEDGQGGGAVHHWTRFAFDPDGFPLPRDGSFRMVAALAPGNLAYAIHLGHSPAGFQLQLRARQDSGAWVFGPWVDITDAAHDLQVEWRSAEAGLSGGALGHARLWIDGAPVTELDGLATSSKRVDLVRYGAITGMPAGASGHLLYDDIQSWTTP